MSGWWHRLVLRLLPRAFRARFETEFAETVEALAADARSRGGRGRQALYVARELAALARLTFEMRRGRAGAGSLRGGLMQDIRWAFRYARRRPSLAATVVVTIMLSVAAATTAFGLASAVLWRPLPFDRATELMFVWEEVERDGQPHPARVTGARHAAWREAADGSASLALFGAAGFTMHTPAGATSIRGVRVSAGYFSTLGIRPVLGRAFAPADEVPGNHRVIIVSTGFWQERLGARQAAIGETLSLSGETYTIVGVMPAAPYPGWPTNPAVVSLDPESRQFWVPIPRTPELDQNGRAHVFGVLARLHGGASPTALVERLNRSADPSAVDPHRARLEPVREQFVTDARLPLIVLAAAALSVLMIASANLAALYAAAFESRRGELSMRLAVGATAGQLVRQIAVEVILLVAAGTVGGTLLAAVALAKAPGLLPPSIPFLTVPAVDVQAVAFGALLGLVTTAVVSGWPVTRLLLSPPSPRGVAPEGRAPVYRVLVVAQVAMAVALTSAAGLLARSLRSIERQDPGFSIARVLVADVGLPQRRPPDGRLAGATERQLLAAVAARPGVESAVTAYDHPLAANWSESPLVTGDATAEAQQRQAQLRIVSPGYFEALSVDLLEGRTLSDRDDFDAPGAAVINEAFAVQLGGRAIGRRLRSSTPSAMYEGAPRDFEIVGVVENERFRGLERPAEPAYYLSTRQFPQAGVTLLVRTSRDPLGLASDVRSAIRATDTTITVDRVTTLETLLGEQLVSRRVTTEIIGAFAVAALGLAAMGMYGLLAMLVGNRTREIGIRLAIGASPASLARQILRLALHNAMLGILLGTAMALATGRLIRSLLVGVSVHDPVMIGFVALVLLTTAFGAALLPAVRAARVDPVNALRRG